MEHGEGEKRSLKLHKGSVETTKKVLAQKARIATYHKRQPNHHKLVIFRHTASTLPPVHPPTLDGSNLEV